jgi:hypothetical protein
MVVLATKCYVAGGARERALDSLRSLVANEIGRLDVTSEVGLREDEFPTVTVDGPDATAARNVLRDAFGEVVPQREAGEGWTGTLEAWDEAGIVLDVGFDDEVRIPQAELGLGPGSPSQIRTRFGLVQHVPLQFVEGDPPRLAESQRDACFEWTRGTGRLNVNSATRAEVRATLNRAGHADDVATVERLGLLEQSVGPREGTDPPGLLASGGKYLRSELLCVIP